MATILVLAHAHEAFANRHFLIEGMFDAWVRAGHRVLVHEGPRSPPRADAVILHVDSSVVPKAYTDALARYPVVINGRVVDVTKRALSDRIVRRDDDFAGRVIVKSNLNAGGFAEWLHAHAAFRKGARAKPPAPFAAKPYVVYEAKSLVPDADWDDRALVVERFLPEQDERGYYVRNWVFLGDRERCNRVLSPHPIVKASGVIERVPAPIPDELRQWRTRLGVDYGKLDFVIHEGAPVLLDVNPTPTLPANLSVAVRQGLGQLAAGIDSLLARRS